jgi:hypothetical protein
MRIEHNAPGQDKPVCSRAQLDKPRWRRRVHERSTSPRALHSRCDEEGDGVHQRVCLVSAGALGKLRTEHVLHSLVPRFVHSLRCTRSDLFVRLYFWHHCVCTVSPGALGELLTEQFLHSLVRYCRDLFTHNDARKVMASSLRLPGVIRGSW